MKTPLVLILVFFLASAALAFDLGSDIPLTTTTGVQARPLLALTPGGVVAVWEENGLRSGLMAGGTSIDVDGNGGYDALTDGLLLLRYMFGIRGNALVAGAIGAH